MSTNEASADEAQQAVIDELDFFDDWTDRYRYLIDMGRALPAFPGELQVDANLIDGCQSQVWMVADGDASNVTFKATSDAAIVSGLIAVLIRIYSERSAAEIVATKARFIDESELSRYLSPTRSNGLASMLENIYKQAQLRIVA
jgi:cysteine desulfuration protein SufE